MPKSVDYGQFLRLEERLAALLAQDETDERNRAIHDLVHHDAAFCPGHARVSAGVMAGVPPGDSVQHLLRHTCCQWGDADAETARTNEEALQARAGLVQSRWRTAAGVDYFIITCLGQRLTVALLPEERDERIGRHG